MKVGDRVTGTLNGFFIDPSTGKETEKQGPRRSERRRNGDGTTIARTRGHVVPHAA